MIAHGFKLNHLYSSVAPGLAKVDKREKNLAKAILSISKGCSLLIARSWQWRNKIWSRPWQCLKVTTEIIQSYQGSEGNGNTCCGASILWPSLFLEENISFINCYFNMNNKKTKDKIIELNIPENIYGTQAKSLPWRKYQLHQLLLQHEQQKHKGQDQRDNIQSNIYGLFLEENIMMNIFILATWQKGSRQSSCSPTRRASPRPPQTRPLHTVSTRSTFTSSYNQHVYGDEPQLEKKTDAYLETLNTGQIENPTRARAGCQSWAGGRHIFNQSLFVWSKSYTETSGQIHAL